MSDPQLRTGSAHAVVIGASIAGCLAARVLSDHYDTVTIVERDNLPSEPVARGGVPQTRHFHQLLARGREVMEQLVPGLTEDLLREGAQMVDSTQALVWLTPAGWAQRYQSGLHVVGVSRDLLEWVLRSRVSAIPNIQMLTHIEVTGLAIDPADGGAAGVNVRTRGESSRPPGLLTADLVVDASGRTSKMPQWLTDVGYEAPAETVVDVGMGYASRFYTIPEGFESDWKAIYIQAAPPSAPRSSIMIEIERGRWLISVNGIGADAPPVDEAGFTSYLAGLRDSKLYEVLKNAKAESPVSGFRHTGNRLRHVDRLQRWPDRFLVMGDALCSFNPVYGQGMTVAALESLELQKLLAHKSRPGFARRFQKRISRLVAGSFTLATSEDYRFGAIGGAIPDRMTRFMHWYLDHITALKVKDRSVNDRFIRVLHMLAGPEVLFHPIVIGKIIRRSMRRKGLARS